MSSSPSIDPGVRPGDVLAGKYRVERILGAGGMGVVVAAHHLQLDEKVALKFLIPDALGNTEALARFEREARAAVKIKSEHVARVSDVGKLENGAPYMVMEYLEGGDVSALLHQQGVLPVEQAVDFVLQTCEAIAEAHTLGIVHRDLKPSNLFCIRRRDGQLSIKVLDFGISKLTLAATDGSGDRDMGMTRTTSVLGSPIYMSPEQMRSSRNVDARTDIWSLGVILFELLTGRVPFEGETVTELAIRIATEPAPPLAGFRAGLPPGLEAIIARCLAKSPDQRFPHVGAMAASLVTFGSSRAAASLERIQGTLAMAGTPVGASPATPSAIVPLPPSEPAQGSTVAPWQSGGVPKRASKAAIGAVVAGGLVLAAIAGGVVFLKARGAPTPATAPSTLATETSSVLPAAAPAPPSPPAASTAGVAETTSSVAVPPPAATPSAVTSSRPTSSPGAASRPAGVARPATPATGTPKPDCTTPYFFDARGNRVFKKECL
ncbi:MAG: protein kinase [Polyangiaceae bacterium]